MNISPKKLQVISSLAQTLSFSKTADICCMTQPGLSRLVKSVEQELGCQLFTRTTRQVQLTQQGLALLPIILKLVHDYEINVLRLRKTASGQKQKIAIAALPSLCALILPNLLVTLEKQFADFDFSVHEASASLAVGLVRDGKADFAVCGVDHVEPDLSHIVVQQDQFVLLCDQAGIAHRPIEQWDERLIDSLPIISMGQGTNARDYIDISFKKSGMEFRPQMELTNLLSIAHFVKKGFGMGLLPKLGAKALIGNDLHIKLLENAPKRNLGIVRRKFEQLPEHLHVAIDFLKGTLISELE